MRCTNLTGRRIGMLTVLEPTSQRVRNAVVWRCRCDCGKEILVESRRLKPGVIYSCGCTPMPEPPGKDLTGLRFGKLTVQKKSGRRARDGNPYWLCRCDCGNEVETTRHRLVTGNVQSCGCGRRLPYKDLTGQRFGMLTVVSYAREDKGFHIWHCRCDCGNEVDVRQSNLQSGGTTSCGCARRPHENLHYVDGTCIEMLRTDTMYKTNTSGVRGGYFSTRRNKWVAQIMFKGKCYNLGGYACLEEAAAARAEAEDKLFGDFLQWYAQAHSAGEPTSSHQPSHNTQ